MKTVHRTLYSAPLVAVLLCNGSVNAQAMTDPTRPPGGALPAEEDSERPRVPVLQSVIITPHHRAAIINGERVALGGSYGGARVSKITETEVVLSAQGRTEVLKMYPNVDKTVKRTDPADKPPTPARGRSTKG